MRYDKLDALLILFVKARQKTERNRAVPLAAIKDAFSGDRPYDPATPIVNPRRLYRRLARLVEKGVLHKPAHGWYEHGNQTPRRMRYRRNFTDPKDETGIPAADPRNDLLTSAMWPWLQVLCSRWAYWAGASLSSLEMRRSFYYPK